MTEGLLSVPTRAFLDRWFPLVVVGLLGLAVLGGYVTYTAQVGEQTTTEERRVGAWSVDTEFDHAATVQRETTVFSAGERLGNRTLYFTGVTPVLDGTYTLAHDNTDGNPASVEITFSRVTRGVGEVDGQEVVYWRNRTPLRTVTRDIDDGGAQTTTVSLNVSDTMQDIGEIERELGAGGGVEAGTPEIRLVADALVQTTIGGETVTERTTDTLTITPEGGIYRVEATGNDGVTREQTEQVTVSDSPSPLATVGGPLLALVGLVGAAVLVRSRDRLAVSESERTRHEFDAARENLDQWISKGTIPTLEDRTEVPVDTLDDLVDVAIDSDRRVIEDKGRFAVLLDDLAYTYTGPTEADHADSDASEDSNAGPSGDADKSNDGDGTTDEET
jgi:hypothetical protein